MLRCCLLTLGLVLAGQLARAQMYILNSNVNPNFQRYDFATNTTTNLTSLTPTTSGNAPVMAGVGNYIYASSFNSSSMRRYDITAATWTTITGNTPIQGGYLYTDGTNLYQRQGNAGLNAAAVSIYNASANSWSTVTAIGSANEVFSGAGYLYMLQSNSAKRYDPLTNTLTTLIAKPSTVANNPYVCADANRLYFVDNNNKLAIYTLSTNSWSTSSASVPANFPNGFLSDGTFLYGKNGSTIYKYTIATGTWATAITTALAGGSSPASVLAGSYYAPAAPVCAAPVVTATVSQATCTGSVVNSNGTIILTAFDANAKKVDYSIGSSYTGAGFASATTLSGSAPYTIISTLANPAVNQPYTIRVFCDAATFTDRTVLLTPKQCQIADLSVAVSPATQTGNAAELLTYTVTLTNSGPNTATNVVIDVPMPDPTASLLSATAATGSYDSVTKEWSIPSLAFPGSTTLTFTVKVN